MTGFGPPPRMTSSSGTPSAPPSRIRNKALIQEMQEEIDEEKEMGLGLPVGVTNAAAQQQMVGDIQAEQEPEQQTQESAGVFTRIKEIL